MRVVAGDIGGTKSLLRCVESSGAVSADARYDSEAFKTFDDLLRDFLSHCPGPVDQACFAVAGPVLGEHAEVTNVGWKIHAPVLAASVGIGRVKLINDFYAIAVGVPLLEPQDLLNLQKGTRDRTAPIGILGAGTGLGEAIVVPHGDQFIVVPSEGGHQDFGPQDDDQAQLYLFLRKKYDGHVSWERVVSGMGISNIYEFMGGGVLEPADIARRADDGERVAARAFKMFVDIYGAEAGNMALRILARGGVFLAGGVAAKNVRWFTDGRFVEAFRRKGRFENLLRDIPVDLITNEHVGLLGAVEAAKRM